jgi:hypothetical protein
MPRVLASCVLALASLCVGGCSFDFDSVCRTGEVCGEIAIEPPPAGEPNVGQGPTCSLVRARCGPDELNQACAFRITGNAVDAPPECRSSFGSSGDGSSCTDATFCQLGLSCYRPTADANGVCVDLCQTVADCNGTSKTCDRSAPFATIGGVPMYRCLDTSLAR